MAALAYPLGHKIKNDPALSAPQMLAKAQALGVKLALSDGELHAVGCRAGIAQLAQDIRACKPQLVQLLSKPATAPDWTPPPPAPDPAKPLPKFHVAQPWNAADKVYQAHHWNCDACKAHARSNGHSDRCATGQQRHDLYERAFEAGKVSQ